MIDAIAVRRTPISGMPKPPATRIARNERDERWRADISSLRCPPTRPSGASTINAVAESISPSYTASMTDDLVWKLGARTPGHDYRIFKTAFVEAFQPQTGVAKQSH